MNKEKKQEIKLNHSKDIAFAALGAAMVTSIGSLQTEGTTQLGLVAASVLFTIAFLIMIITYQVQFVRLLK